MFGPELFPYLGLLVYGNIAGKLNGSTYLVLQLLAVLHFNR